ncbi:MAG TPA: AAA family ATPase [Clostridia bacterium]|nr:AAA family ATPase [Clostridia bacterium]
MIKRIHIIGASGSGTSTLGRALAENLGYKHFDTDDYFWLSKPPLFTQKRERTDRQELLRMDLDKYESWILTGTLCGWGDIFIPYFDLVVYLWVPKDIRIKRLIERERQRYGSDIEPGGSRYESYQNFIEWASKYDEAGLDMRSRALHEYWMSTLTCPTLRIEGDFTVEERIEAVLKKVTQNNFR